jgi:hypothetical protein
MLETVVDKVIQSISHAANLYYRLVILVAPLGSGKTTTLREVSNRLAVPLVNVNLELSSRMLSLTATQRSLQVINILREIVNSYKKDVVLLDNIELLFDVSLKQKPLELLQMLSRNKTIVVAWSGEIRDEGDGRQSSGAKLDASCDSFIISQSPSLYLTYATPDHPEYKRYPIKDFLVITIDKAR